MGESKTINAGTTVNIEYEYKAILEDKLNEGKVICTSDGTIEEYVGKGLYKVVIPGDVMEEAVRIALDKINNKLEEK